MFPNKRAFLTLEEMRSSILWKPYILTVILWVTIPCGLVGGYWHF